MDASPRQDEYDRNDSIMSTENSFTETEKEQLLGLLPSSDSPLRERKSRVSRLCYVIALLFLSNVALLAALLVVRRSNEAAPPKPWLPPEIPRKETFIFQTIYGEPPSEEAEAAWDALMPLGRGFVIIKNDTALPELPRLNQSITEQHAMVSVFHQLHCLYMTRKAYFSVRAGNIDQIDPVHMMHCWDFLRQAIMCAADTSLEWLPAPPNDIGSTGWGFQHTCRDFGAIHTWAADHRVRDSSGIH